MSKIAKLPEEIELRLPEIKEEWAKTGLSTEPANRALAGQGVKLAYQAAGLEPPEHIIWFDSPVKSSIFVYNLYFDYQTDDFLQAQNQAKKHLSISVWEELKDKFGNKVKDTVWDKLKDQRRTQLSNRIENDLKIHVWMQIKVQLNERLKRNIEKELIEDIGNVVWKNADSVLRSMTRQNFQNVFKYGFSQYDVDWLAYFNVFKDLVDGDKILEGLTLIMANCGWCWPFENVVILAERPVKLQIDEDCKLHADDGPALVYPDGYSGYFWHGKVLHEGQTWVITDKEKITPEEILNNPSARFSNILHDIYEHVHNARLDLSALIQRSKGLENRIPKIKKELLETGLSIVPANRKLAEQGIDLLYKSQGLRKPKNKIWLQSPLEGIIAASILHLTNQFGSKVEENVRMAGGLLASSKLSQQYQSRSEFEISELIIGNVENQIEDKITCKIQEKITEELTDFNDRVEEKIDDQLLSTLVKRINPAIQQASGLNLNFENYEQIVEQLWDQIEECCYGQHELDFLLPYLAFQGGNQDTKSLKGHWMIAQSAGWWWPFERAVILTERPIKLSRDDAGCLHCDDGPALVYPDGFSLYAWHGTRIPSTHQWVITDKSRLTNEIIKSEKDDEIRGIMKDIQAQQS